MQVVHSLAVGTLRTLAEYMCKQGVVRKPALATLARVDIGLWENSQGELSWYVNEVQVGNGVALWCKDEDHIRSWSLAVGQGLLELARP